MLACCVQVARVIEASRVYLDDTLYLHHVDGKAHSHLLLDTATLRGQQAAVYLKACSGSLAIESTQMERISSAGDGNCAYYTVCNGLNTINNKVCTVSCSYKYSKVCTYIYIYTALLAVTTCNDSISYTTTTAASAIIVNFIVVPQYFCRSQLVYAYICKYIYTYTYRYVLVGTVCCGRYRMFRWHVPHIHASIFNNAYNTTRRQFFINTNYCNSRN